MTDADVLLGRLDRRSLRRRSSVALDVEAAARRDRPTDIGSRSAHGGGRGCVRHRRGRRREHGRAARVHAIERGRDVRRCTMVAFGGAAPLHACRLADKLGIDRILVPQGAGVGSAIGFLRAPISLRGGAHPPPTSRRLRTCTSWSRCWTPLKPRPGPWSAAPRRTRSTVVERPGGDALRRAGPRGRGGASRAAGGIEPADLHARFEDAYHVQFARTIPNLPVEVLSWMLTVSTPIDAVQPLTVGPLDPLADDTTMMGPARRSAAVLDHRPGRGGPRRLRAWDPGGTDPPGVRRGLCPSARSRGDRTIGALCRLRWWWARR